jgi:hypothetical protein
MRTAAGLGWDGVCLLPGPLIHNIVITGRHLGFGVSRKVVPELLMLQY